MQLSCDYACDAMYNIEAIYNTVQQNHYFSSNNVRLLASRSLHVKTNSQNDWSVTNQIGYAGLRQDFKPIVYL